MRGKEFGSVFGQILTNFPSLPHAYLVLVKIRANVGTIMLTKWRGFGVDPDLAIFLVLMRVYFKAYFDWVNIWPRNVIICEFKSENLWLTRIWQHICWNAGPQSASFTLVTIGSNFGVICGPIKTGSFLAPIWSIFFFCCGLWNAYLRSVKFWPNVGVICDSAKCVLQAG